MMMDFEIIQELRDEFTRDFSDELRNNYNIVLPANHIKYLIDELEKKDSRIILDLGLGFSAVALRAWAKKSGARIITGCTNEHAIEHFMYKYKLSDMFTIQKLKHPSFHDVLRARCDCVLVNHYIHIYKRFEDIPWVATLMSNNGFMVFTDCREDTSYENNLRRVLNILGWGLDVIENLRIEGGPTLGVSTRIVKETNN